MGGGVQVPFIDSGRGVPCSRHGGAGPRRALRVALGSVAPTVVRLPKTEAALEISVEQAQRALREEIKPIDDIRSTAEYRLRVACNLLARFWRETS